MLTINPGEEDEKSKSKIQLLLCVHSKAFRIHRIEQKLTPLRVTVRFFELSFCVSKFRPEKVSFVPVSSHSHTFLYPAAAGVVWISRV